MLDFREGRCVKGLGLGLGTGVGTEESNELEEGEACLYKDDDDDNDLDVNFSFNIDERIQHALGHFQKCFEDGASTENLGLKFDVYGSFLPAHERSPSILSHLNTRQKIHNMPRSSDVLPLEGAFQNLKAPSNIPPPDRSGSTSNANIWHNTRLPSGNVSDKQESCLPYTEATYECFLKDETSSRTSNLTEQRPLKFRIKVGSDTSAHKNAALYCGLGLDNSPYSSSGSSSAGSEGMPPVFLDTFEESPSDIIKVMTSLAVPEGLLVSPLPDSLLWFSRNKEFRGVRKSLVSPKSYPAILTAPSKGEGKLLKEKKKKLRGMNQVELKHEHDRRFDNSKNNIKKQNSEKLAAHEEEFLTSEFECRPLSTSESCGGGSIEVPCRPSEVSREVNKVGMKDRSFTSELVKQSQESTSGQDCGKNDQKNSRIGMVEKNLELKVAKAYSGALVELRDNGKFRCNKPSAPLKDLAERSRCNNDVDLHRKASQIATCRMEGESLISLKKKPTSEGKHMLKGLQNNGDSVAVSTKCIFRSGTGAAPKDKKNAHQCVSPFSSKMGKLKSHRDKKRRNSQINFIGNGNLEKLGNCRETLEMTSGEWPDGSNKAKEHALGNIRKDRLNGKRGDTQSMAVVSLQDAQTACPSIAVNGPTSEASPADKLDNWVCCDSCQTWRLLPFDMKPGQLPEKWVCSMQHWLPHLNRCGISERETTAAIYASYQLPVPESLQSWRNGAVPGAISADVNCLGKNQNNFSSRTMSDEGKKKQSSKDIHHAGGNSDLVFVSNSTKNLHESKKRRSLNDTNYHPSEPNQIRKSIVRPLNDAKQLKMKKKEANQHGYGPGTSKKYKTEDMHFAEKQKDAEMNLGKVRPSSFTDTPVVTRRKDVQEYIEIGFSEGKRFYRKNKILISGKKLGNQAQVPSDDGSLDVRAAGKRDSSMKKRKLKEWQDSQNCQISVLDGCVDLKEKSSESGFRRGKKKSRVSNSAGNDSRTSNDGGNLKKNGTVMQICLSGNRDCTVYGAEEVRDFDEEQELRKHGRKGVSQLTLEGGKSVRRDIGSWQFSLAATPSSSKLSGCGKNRTNFEEIKCSPAESVLSPLGTSNNIAFNQARRVRRGKESSGSHPKPRRGSTLEDRGRDVHHKCIAEVEHSTEVQSCYLLNGDANIVEQVGNGDMEHSHNGDRIKKLSSDEVLQQRNEDPSLRSKNKEKNSISDADINEMQPSGFVGKHSKRSLTYAQEIDPDSGKFGPGTVSDDKPSIAKRFSSNLRENEKNYVCTKNSKNKEKTSTSDVDVNEIQPSGFVRKHSKKGFTYEQEIDPDSGNFGTGTVSDDKLSIAKGRSSNLRANEKNHVSTKNFVRPCSSNNRVETQLQNCDASDLRLLALCSTNGKVGPHHNLIMDFESEHKADVIQAGSISGKTRYLLHSEDVCKQEKVSLSPSLPASQKSCAFDGCPVDATGSVDLPKASKQPGIAGNQNGVGHGKRHLMPDQQGFRDPDVLTPDGMNSSSQASNILKEAQSHRDYGDQLKSSGFGFESSEAYFKSALKFLHGASLLEACNPKSGYGEMAPLQMYRSTAKLCEVCALGYEKCQEMAASALAYKCMEVACMRVVYCKHASTSRDWHELQSKLHVVPRGESPSSSASDVDNLNHPATVDKTPLSKCTGSLVAGSHVILARNHPNFVRLLDFTQDVNLAMEASRKSLNAFAIANETIKAAQSAGCVASIKRVIDFGFQDVEELVRLVTLAWEAIDHSGFDGARD